MATEEPADPSRIEVDVGAHEHELAACIHAEAPEYEVAHWATSNLAVALQTAGKLPPPAREVPEHFLRRALLVSAARIFRLSRAGMVVIRAGYEVEARSFDRSILETRGRREQVMADASGQLARRWLAGKLRGGLGAAVRESLPQEDSGRPTAIYGVLSGDIHPDLRQFMANLVRQDSNGRYEMAFSPKRTHAARSSLFLYAWLSAEATVQIGVSTGIHLPHHAALERALLAAADQLRQQLADLASASAK